MKYSSSATPITTTAVETHNQNSSESTDDSRLEMDFSRAEIALSKAEASMWRLRKAQKICAIIMVVTLVIVICVSVGASIWCWIKDHSDSL